MRSSTLRRRLNILFGGWVFLFLAVSGAVVWMGYGSFHEAALSQRLVLARTVAQSVDGSLANTFLGLRRLRADLGSLEGDLAPRLRGFRMHSMFRDAIYLLDADGELVAADPENVTPLPLDVLAKHEIVTSLIVKEGLSERPILAVSQPFKRSGERFYLVAEMVPLGASISTMLQDLAPETDMHIVLVDRSAWVIAAPDYGQLYRRIEAGEALVAGLAAKRDSIADERGRQRPDVDWPFRSSSISTMANLFSLSRTTG